ncbi:MAG: hypothetical protein ACFB2X_02350 [Rivularia sp. (in: cyanobacteria)]
MNNIINRVIGGNISNIEGASQMCKFIFFGSVSILLTCRQ